MIEGLDDLVSFLRAFHASWTAAPGLAEHEVPQDLPAPLRRLYREFGSLIALQGGPFARQDSLVPLGRLRRIDGMVEFAWENQGNWSCRTALSPGDSPVYSNAVVYWDEPAEGFQKVCDSLEHFLVTLCLQEAAMSAPYLVQPIDGASPEDVFLEALEPLWPNGQYVWAAPSHAFHRLPGHDVLVMDSQGLWIASHSAIPQGVLQPGISVQRMA